jgi:hypothetical protein
MIKRGLSVDRSGWRARAADRAKRLRLLRGKRDRNVIEPQIDATLSLCYNF